MSHTTKNILIGLLILVILFLLTCNGNEVEIKPTVTPVDTIIKRVEVADKEIQKIVDSTYKVITQLKSENSSITKQLQAARYEI